MKNSTKQDWKKFRFVKNRFIDFYDKLQNDSNYLSNRKRNELYTFKWNLTINKIISKMNFIHTPSNVLEIGAGWGRVIVGLKKAVRNLKISAIDISKMSYFLCKKVLKEEELNDNITFKIGRAEKIPFEDNSFDNVISVRVFQFLKDPLLAVRECKRVLKKGGKLVLILPNKYNLKHMLFYRTELFYFKEMKNWFKKNNFSNIKLETYSFIPGRFKWSRLLSLIENFIEYFPILNRLGGLVIISGTKNE